MKAYVKRSNEPNSNKISIDIQKMTGRIYKPGKDFKGDFIDTVGEPDNRYRVYPDKESIKKDFVLCGEQLTNDPVKFFA